MPVCMPTLHLLLSLPLLPLLLLLLLLSLPVLSPAPLPSIYFCDGCLFCLLLCCHQRPCYVMSLLLLCLCLRTWCCQFFLSLYLCFCFSICLCFCLSPCLCFRCSCFCSSCVCSLSAAAFAFFCFASGKQSVLRLCLSSAQLRSAQLHLSCRQGGIPVNGSERESFYTSLWERGRAVLYQCMTVNESASMPVYESERESFYDKEGFFCTSVGFCFLVFC